MSFVILRGLRVPFLVTKVTTRHKGHKELLNRIVVAQECDAKND